MNIDDILKLISRRRHENQKNILLGDAVYDTRNRSYKEGEAAAGLVARLY
jgi:hypothetical protein